MSEFKARDLALAHKANRAGASYSLRIILEARRAGIPVSLGFALIEQESSFRNIFGSDPTIYVGAGKVTKNKYLDYKARRGSSKMQGVGPAQLTWYEFQNQADRMGGCWKPAINIRVGFMRLADNIKRQGSVRDGLRAYNGAGPAAERYALQVMRRRDRWHRVLT